MYFGRERVEDQVDRLARGDQVIALDVIGIVRGDGDTPAERCEVASAVGAVACTRNACAERVLYGTRLITVRSPQPITSADVHTPAWKVRLRVCRKRRRAYRLQRTWST